MGCPILDPEVREKIWNVIHLQWSDNTKAMKLLPERKYEPVTGEGSVNSQEEQMKLAEKSRRKADGGEDKNVPQKNLWQRIIHWGK